MRKELLRGKADVTKLAEFKERNKNKPKRIPSDLQRQRAFRNAIYDRRIQHIQESEGPGAKILPFTRDGESK